jgi:hypothetical protein
MLPLLDFTVVAAIFRAMITAVFGPAPHQSPYFFTTIPPHWLSTMFPLRALREEVRTQ